LPADAADHGWLHDIRKSLDHLTKGSIRGRVRELVRRAAPQPEAATWAKRGTALYDLRSTLVHDGTLSASDLEKGASEAVAIVEMVLRAEMAATTTAL
jgi:hypothetical protein